MAFVFLQEELEHLQGSQQLSLLKEQHPELIKWHQQFRKVIEEFEGVIPYPFVD